MFLGTYPGLTIGMIGYMVQVIRDFVLAATDSSSVIGKTTVLKA
jgi:hypothetical protein